jgi:mRNA turnover protein 4
VETIERHPGAIELPFTLEPTLRKLGMPTILKSGEIQLLGEYSLCRAGVPLNVAAAKLLKVFEIKLAELSVSLKMVFSDEEVENLTTQ